MLRSKLWIAVLLLCLVLAPGVSLAKKGKGKGIGAGGVPALRDRIVVLEHLVADLQERLAELEALASDDDGDGRSENQGDCDDTDPFIGPGATDDPATEIDEDCDGETGANGV
jgi:hypothetical protein